MAVWWNSSSPPTEINPAVDPPPATSTPFVSPYRNTRPGVAYVGDAACVACHAKTCETYHAHPMGRSMGAVGEKGGGPFVWNGVRYSVEKKGENWVHREEAVDGAGRVVARTEVPVRHAVGSGTHAVSYLIDRGGVVSQSPITWYAATNAIGLSPGFETVADKFERAVLPGCVFCHVNEAQGVPHSLNAFQPLPNLGTSIGCERCHGPGALHVSERKKSPNLNGLDDTIVNPVDLSPALREDVCNQCHLGGKERVTRRGKGAFDYRPGLPLEEFIRVFVVPTTATSNARIAGHVEQMNASQCFVASKGEMGCASCHDPHAKPSAGKAAEYFRGRCLDCHKEKGCSEPLPRRLAVSKADECATCHMPKAKTMISHVALTDHRVPRRPTEGPAPASLGEAEVLSAIRSLVPFGKATLDAGDAEQTRDWAVGLTARARTLPEAVRREVAQASLSILERAVKHDPDDLPAREGQVMALAWLDLTGPALAACDEGLARAPARELLLSDAGVLSQKLGFAERSLGYWRRALAVNPHSSRYRFEVANGLAATGDWPGAVREAEAVLAANGGHVSSRLLLMQYFWQNGAKDRAKAEWIAIQAMKPANEAVLRRQFGPLFP